MKVKILKTALVSVLCLCLTVTPALAVADVGNTYTGAQSTNNTSVTTNRTVTVTNTNTSSVTNTVSSWVNSGYNSASHNTGNGTISTGGASWRSSFSTDANCSETDLTMDVAGDPTATNDNTGAESTNNAVVEVDNTTTLTNVNDSEITNTMNVDVDSGNNDADYNTGSGSVTTGDSEASGSVETQTNANSAIIAGSGAGVHSASNDTTGWFSINNATVDIDNLTEFNNHNDSLLDNYLDVWVDSGDNSASYNTGNGGIVTGGADAAGSGLDILNLANGNFATIEGGVGETTGSASNDTTGADSDNDALVYVENTVTLLNDNWGYIDNEVITSALSGWNTADYNTGNASVDTDSSSTAVGIGNVLNSNTSSVGSEIPLQSSGEAFNEWTGDESFNDAIVNTINSLDVTNNNNVLAVDYGVDNDVDADAISGENSADYNTGNSDTETGKSDVLVGLATEENTNMTLFAGFGTNTDSMWNSHTGYLSDNDSVVTHTDTVSAVADNWGWIANIFNDDAISGDNTADYNTGDSSITTDDAGLIESTNDSQNYNFFGWPTP